MGTYGKDMKTYVLHWKPLKKLNERKGVAFELIKNVTEFAFC